MQCITRLKAKFLFIHFVTWTLSRFSINFRKISKKSQKCTHTLRNSLMRSNFGQRQVVTDRHCQKKGLGPDSSYTDAHCHNKIFGQRQAVHCTDLHCYKNRGFGQMQEAQTDTVRKKIFCQWQGVQTETARKQKKGRGKLYRLTQLEKQYFGQRSGVQTYSVRKTGFWPETSCAD